MPGMSGAIDETSEEYLDVTPDGAVRKRVLVRGRAGDGGEEAGDVRRPPQHARCLVHYKGITDEGGEVFMDTRAEYSQPVTIVAGRVASPTQQGIAAALCHMCRGEKAEVKCTPEYGYGAKGSFSFPSVPPNAHLTYEVELLDWEDPQDLEDPSAYTFFEEKVEAAERRRLQGNELFRAGDPLSALGRYSMALSFLPEDLIFQLHGFHEEAAWNVKLPTLLNMAACQLKLEDYNAAISSCNQALERDKNNIKALFRRGTAKQALGQTDAARRDLEQALKLAPNDAAVRKALQALRREEKMANEATAAAFRGKLSAPSEPAKTTSSGGSSEPTEGSTRHRNKTRAEGFLPLSVIFNWFCWIRDLVTTLLFRNINQRAAS